MKGVARIAPEVKVARLVIEARCQYSGPAEDFVPLIVAGSPSQPAIACRKNRLKVELDKVRLKWTLGALARLDLCPHRG